MTKRKLKTVDADRDPESILIPSKEHFTEIAEHFYVLLGQLTRAALRYGGITINKSIVVLGGAFPERRQVAILRIESDSATIHVTEDSALDANKIVTMLTLNCTGLFVTNKGESLHISWSELDEDILDDETLVEIENKDQLLGHLVGTLRERLWK